MIKTYAHHRPSQEAIKRIKIIRTGFSELHLAISALAPMARETNIAYTKLEEAAMWAIKAIVVNDPNSVVEE